ncbi:MAG: class I SAM-dependent methyltransferase [Actinomycetota bacterium]|nr:class I SAM-dependent methyltransferase [Actinomycetota bacterium]
MRKVQPLKNLALLLPRHPLEFRERVAAYACLGFERLFGGLPDYETTSWQAAISEIEARLGRVTEILEEPALKETEENTRRLLKDIRGRDPFSPRWAADSRFARLGYLLCRLISPSVVLETGVAYGVSSAFILKALEQNGRGMLYSVDLPPLRRDYERFWGIAVPEALRGRWRLRRGSSAKVLPRLLEEIPTVDLFVHDSLHTHRNMRSEFDTVWPRLRIGGLLIADDVERNRAFGDLRQKDPTLWRVVKDREESPLHGRAAPVVFGIAMK